MVRVLYIILLIAAAFFYPLYEDKLSFITLVTLIILPVILLCQLIISAVFLKCSVPRESVTIFRGGEGEICLRLSNNSVFPLSGCKVRVKVIFRPTGEVRYYTAAVPLPALRTETVSVNIGGRHCGAAEAYLEYVKIYDLLRLFSVKKFRSKKLCGTMYIIPKISEKYFDEARRILSLPPCESLAESEYTRSSGSGTPGDVCGFREFAPGDRLSMMHYKLSARFDSDIVKILSVQNSSRYLLSADISASGSGNDLDTRDNILEKLMSCAYYLNEQNAEVYTAVPVGSSCRKIMLDSGEAAEYIDRASYFPIARALAAADFQGIPPENGFIYCKITEDIDE